MKADTTRRALLGGLGLASATLLAPALAPAKPHVGRISADLAALFEAERVAKQKQEHHERAVIEHPDFKAKDFATRKELGAVNDALLCDWCSVQHAIAGFPVKCAGDLEAKLRFMIANEMGDGMDWQPELLVDASRLVKAEGR